MTVSQKMFFHRLVGTSSTRNDREVSYSTKHGGKQNNMILACSAVEKPDSDLQRMLTVQKEGRTLLSDRRRPFSHLRPQPLLKSCIRVLAVQVSVTYATFVTDQLEEETKREDLVQEGKLTAAEADKKNEEWETREWALRWENFSTKVFHAILKYQAVTLTMRFYEHVASRLFSDFTLDRLTLDPFYAAKRLSKRTSDSSEMRRVMNETCFWSNIVAFLADYTVHQAILAYGYYMYYSKRRRQLKDRPDSGKTSSGEPQDEEGGPIALSFLFKSSKLAVSRSLGLLFASYGGAIGSTFYPGWGTLIGTQVGDGLISTALDDVHSHPHAGQIF